jgi:iron(III) transport system permease protein
MRVIELRTINGWGLASGLSATLPLSALAGLVWLAAQPDAPVWAHLWANVLPQQATTTLLLMLGVAALTGFVGTLSAWIVTFYRIPLRRFIGWSLLLPLAMPTYLMAYSYGDFLDQAGPLYGRLAKRRAAACLSLIFAHLAARLFCWPWRFILMSIFRRARLSCSNRR